MQLKYILIIVMLLIPLTMGAVETLGTFKQNENVELRQVVSGASFCNVSSVVYPNSSKAITNVEMTQDGNEYSYTFSNTSNLGSYIVNGYCGNSTDESVFAYDFEITPSGMPGISSGGGISLFGSLFVMILIGSFFFILSMRLESTTSKIIFITFSSIMLLMVVFYSMVIVQQNLGGYESLVSGYSAFFTVLKILTGIAVTAFLIFALLVAIRYYKFKRGWID